MRRSTSAKNERQKPNYYNRFSFLLYATKELNLADMRIEHLEKEAEKLRNELFWANLRIKGLEKFLPPGG